MTTARMLVATVRKSARALLPCATWCGAFVDGNTYVSQGNTFRRGGETPVKSWARDPSTRLREGHAGPQRGRDDAEDGEPNGELFLREGKVLIGMVVIGWDA